MAENIKDELIGQDSFVKSLATAFAGIKDPAAFSMGQEKITVSYGKRNLSLSADQLIRFTSNLKSGAVAMFPNYLKMMVSQKIAGLEIPNDSPVKTEAELYNTQRQMELGGNLPFLKDIHMMGMYFSRPGKSADFKGDYLRCMTNLYHSSSSDNTKESTKRNILYFLAHSTKFNQKLDAVEKPPVPFTAKDKVNLLEEAGCDIAYHQTPEEGRKNRLRLINMTLKDKEIAPEAQNLLKDLVNRQAESLGGMFGDTRAPDQSMKQSMFEQQKDYLQQTKEMIVLTRGQPELQEVFAEQLAENSKNFHTKDLREDAMNFVMNVCEGTNAATIAEKNYRFSQSCVGKVLDFSDNVENLLGKTMLGKALGVIPLQKTMKLTG